MRTTIRLDDDLMRAVKRHALESGMTVTAVIAQSLRERLQRQRDRIANPPTPLSLVTTGEGGLLPGVDLDDSARLSSSSWKTAFDPSRRQILVYAQRRDAPDHRRYLEWLISEVDSNAAFGLSPLVLSGFIRVVTHPKIFKTPSTLSEATAFAEQLRERPNSVSGPTASK